MEYDKLVVGRFIVQSPRRRAGQYVGCKHRSLYASALQFHCVGCGSALQHGRLIRRHRYGHGVVVTNRHRERVDHAIEPAALCDVVETNGIVRVVFIFGCLEHDGLRGGPFFRCERQRRCRYAQVCPGVSDDGNRYGLRGSGAEFDLVGRPCAISLHHLYFFRREDDLKSLVVLHIYVYVYWAWLPRSRRRRRCG